MDADTYFYWDVELQWQIGNRMKSKIFKVVGRDKGEAADNAEEQFNENADSAPIVGRVTKGSKARVGDQAMDASRQLKIPGVPGIVTINGSGNSWGVSVSYRSDSTSKSGFKSEEEAEKYVRGHPYEFDLRA